MHNVRMEAGRENAFFEPSTARTTLFASWALAQDDDPSCGRRLASGWRGDQSLGGKATRQKVGLGSKNSTPTFTGSFGNRSMWATTHSSESLVCGFPSVSRWPR